MDGRWVRGSRRSLGGSVEVHCEAKVILKTPPSLFGEMRDAPSRRRGTRDQDEGAFECSAEARDAIVETGSGRSSKIVSVVRASSRNVVVCTFGSTVGCTPVISESAA